MSWNNDRETPLATARIGWSGPVQGDTMKASRTVLLAFVIVVAVAAALLAGCAATTPTPSPTPTNPKGGTLTGFEWQLNTLNGQQAPAGPKPVTANFDAKTLSGFAGVNTYSGGYTAGADGAFKAGPLAATQMAGPPEAMQLESGYLQALQAATTYQAADGKLTLYGPDGTPTITFLAAKPASLPGSKWEAVNYNNGKQAVITLEKGSKITADFGTDGKVSGNASINTYSATYAVTGDTIKFGPATTTRMAGSETLMAQETAYLKALENATTWKITGGNLELRDGSGALQVLYNPAK
jgi:heat shock protein HslJ